MCLNLKMEKKIIKAQPVHADFLLFFGEDFRVLNDKFRRGVGR